MLSDLKALCLKTVLTILRASQKAPNTRKQEMKETPRIQQDWKAVAADVDWDVDSDDVASIRSANSWDDCTVRISPAPMPQQRKNGKFVAEMKPK